MTSDRNHPIVLLLVTDTGLVNDGTSYLLKKIQGHRKDTGKNTFWDGPPSMGGK